MTARPNMFSLNPVLSGTLTEIAGYSTVGPLPMTLPDNATSVPWVSVVPNAHFPMGSPKIVLLTKFDQ